MILWFFRLFKKRKIYQRVNYAEKSFAKKYNVAAKLYQCLVDANNSKGFVELLCNSVSNDCKMNIKHH